jgi:hypothetical protein
MRLPDSAHTSRPWRVHEVAGDFALEDVWRLPTPGGPDDLGRVVALFAAPSREGDFPRADSALFALRWKLGELFGWDRAGSGLGTRVPSVRERLPPDLLDGPRGPDVHGVPGRPGTQGEPVFTSVYLTDDEWLAEFANGTVHGLLHLGWVPDARGDGFHAQMAVLVKPAGPLGRAYLTAIKPFRLALVYPALLRWLGRQWQRQAAGDVAPATRAAV